MFLKRIGVPFMALTMLGLFGLVASASTGPANGDFETGDLSGWEVFTTANGTGSTPVVDQIDIANVGVTTNAVKLSVGQVSPDDGGCGSDGACRNANFAIFEGAGIRQSFDVGAGGEVVSVSANVAASSPASFDAETGGLFELLVDDSVVDWVLFTGIAGGTTLGDSLAASVPLSEGSHTVAVRVSRPWGTFGMNSSSPNQYVDEVFVGVTPVPTPTPEPTEVPEPAETPEPEQTPEPVETPEPVTTPEPEVTPESTPVPTATPGIQEVPTSNAPSEPDVEEPEAVEETAGLQELRVVMSGSENRFAVLIDMLLQWLYRLFNFRG